MQLCHLNQKCLFMFVILWKISYVEGPISQVLITGIAIESLLHFAFNTDISVHHENNNNNKNNTLFGSLICCYLKTTSCLTKLIKGS